MKRHWFPKNGHLNFWTYFTLLRNFLSSIVLTGVLHYPIDLLDGRQFLYRVLNSPFFIFIFFTLNINSWKHVSFEDYSYRNGHFRYFMNSFYIMVRMFLEMFFLHSTIGRLFKILWSYRNCNFGTLL